MAYRSDHGYLLNLVATVSKLDYLCDVTLVAGLGGEKCVFFLDHSISRVS